MTKTHAFCSSFLILTAFSVHAHHSRAPFLLDETFEIEGTVTEVAWRSPHVYMEVLAVNPEGSETTWTYEGHSVAGLKRFGWTEDTFAPGDRVVVVANPNRDPDKRFGLLDSVTRTDGETFYSFRIPESEGGNPRRRPLAGSTDFSGHWNRIGTLRQALVGGFGPPTGWPVTAAGQAQIDAFDPDDNPTFDCETTGIPGLILSPYTHLWIVEEDRIVIEKDQSPLTRVIHLDGSPPPPDYEPNLLGYSVGHFEDDGTLVVETTGFSPTRWGLTRGIDSSDQKRITERYWLEQDGYVKRVSYTVEDPVYLTEPVTRDGGYTLIPAHEFTELPCDPETARRHLQFE